MRISIVTVCRNSISTIERCIESVVSQISEDIEYIIIDGNSDDGTVDVIKRYDHYLSYWVSEDDNGIYDAMNKGIRRATGDYIAFLNSDDFYEDGELSRVLAEIKVHGEPYILYGNAHMVYEDGTVNEWTLSDDNIDSLIYGMVILHPSTFCKKILFDEIGLFNTGYKIAADYDWLLHVYLEKGRRSFIHSDSFSTYFNQGGISNRDYMLSQEEAVKISLKYAKQYNYPEEKIRELKERISDNISAAVFDRYDEPKKKLREYLTKDNRKIWVFGAGKAFSPCKKYLESIGLTINGILDNDENKVGTVIEGVPVSVPSVETAGNDIIIISSYRYEKEIRKDLINIGFDDCSVLTLNDLRKMAMEEGRNMLIENHFFEITGISGIEQ